jgi:hypothetical protein
MESWGSWGSRNRASIPIIGSRTELSYNGDYGQSCDLEDLTDLDFAPCLAPGLAPCLPTLPRSLPRACLASGHTLRVTLSRPVSCSIGEMPQPRLFGGREKDAHNMQGRGRKWPVATNGAARAHFPMTCRGADMCARACCCAHCRECGRVVAKCTSFRAARPDAGRRPREQNRIGRARPVHSWRKRSAFHSTTVFSVRFQGR